MDAAARNSDNSLPFPTARRAHGFGGGATHLLPMTPGEEIDFDKGLLFQSIHRGSRGSDPGPALLSSTPLPSINLDNFRSNSDPDTVDPGASVIPTRSSLDQFRRAVPSHEIQSAPIHLPVIHYPSPTLSNRASTVHSQGYPSRPPSPNSSAITQASDMSKLPTPPQNLQQYLSPVGSDTSLHEQPFAPSVGEPRHHYNQYSTLAALRPDSACSFPDNSPLMAPNVLAAVDARLRESSRQRALADRSSISSLYPQRPQSTPGSAHSDTSEASKTARSSASLVVTHHTILQNSESVMSREDLYDVLNKDDDDDDIFVSESDSGLMRPRPAFTRHIRRSSKSSQRSSNTSSSLSSSRTDSGLELSATGRRYLAASLPRHVQAAKVGEGSVMNLKRKELVTAAMVSKDEKHESHTSADSVMSDSPYPEKSEWLRKKTKSSRKWRGTCYIIGIIFFIALVAGIVLGFVLRKGKIDGLAPPPNPTTSTPPITQFTPNPNLHKSFYGIDYNPAKSLMPWCGVTLQNVVDDVILMSQLTNRIRLYGMDCQQADLTFQAISALNLNSTMKVVLTVWVDNNTATYQSQYDTLFRVLDLYGTDMVEGVSVGNEVLFRQDMNLTALGSLMATVRSNIKSRYGKTIPVFTSDIGPDLNATLASYSDELSGNLHPYFAGIDVSAAANWTLQQFNDTILANPTKAGLKGSISEVGWPSGPATAVFQPSAVPGLANLQTMVDSFICQANAQGVPYYWFEFKDEPWKTDPTVPVEPFWGIFDKDGNLKIKIPDCVAP
ncbi:hypothetical protein BGZ99_002371 [Dissophora globulifera]|uniref:glucan endo-1,3-beta-D-glucosidase n=1 Tax=Dissophora globulifera TaxID=979702 RepID=A0A9P6RYD6_9FUNG|nr:hypothetical protein BGZ99_002371 [Dissophora globulifera]